MFRRWFVLTLIALQWLPALALVPGQTGALSLEIDHAVVHQIGHGHHHDETFPSQADDDGAVPHAHPDTGHASALPLADRPLHPVVTVPPSRLAFRGAWLPDPPLDGPLRPPRPAV